VLAYGFTKNHLFAAKTDQNSVFLGRDLHILNQKYIKVPYVIFNEFYFFKIFTQNPYVLAYGFTENHHFVAKTDLNYIFFGRDPHILDL
jgi:hypothetical protein